MRLSLRFLIPLFVVLGIIAYAVLPLVDKLMEQWFVRDLDLRAKVIASTIDDSLFQVIDNDKTRTKTKVQAFFDRVVEDERLFALGFCDADETLVYKTETFPGNVACKQPNTEDNQQQSEIVALPKGSVHVAYDTITGSGGVLGQLILVHDMSFIQRRSSSATQYILYFFVLLGGVISLITVIIAQLSWRGWVSGMRGLLRGEGLVRPLVPVTTSSELQPIASELRDLLRDLEYGRNAADDAQMKWTPDTLKQLLKQEFVGDEVIVVSHREPYIHERKDDAVAVRKPATGVITALEPVMRACSGTWVALGSGSADREVVDEHDHVAVPPDDPAYTLRRVWLPPEDEKAHHLLSTEGFYALCLLAHVRPVFQPDYWAAYRRVNERFADVVVAEAKTKDPVILVQDYHFALLPRMLRERLPQATIITFWHIPWPNAEAFSICPWAEEILGGLLGSSILGFHTKYHCHNFFETANRFLECRIDLEQFLVSYRKSLTAVNAYPISIDFPEKAFALSIEQARSQINADYGIDPGVSIGVGVDRLDYTKGICEKFAAIGRLLEHHPEWRGKFSFIQIAAPTRAYITEYRKTEEAMVRLADDINGSFGHGEYRPIILVREYKNTDALNLLYRAADFCFVNSLHDGMNLVAKEFVAARDDEQGVLVLSQFTGATRELTEALIVNPYHADQCADALHRALSMPQTEQRHRMRSMRSIIHDFNVYRWAGKIFIDAARMRQRSRFAKTIFGRNEDASA